MDFIRREQLLAAMSAWLLEKKTQLEDILLRQGALDDDTRRLLVALVAKHLALHDNDAEKSLQAVNAFGPVRDDLGSLEDPNINASLGHVGAGAEMARDYATIPPMAAPTSQHSRFRILHFHREGGLGKVSVAFDNELSREVALKEIKEKHADNLESRARFMAEAKITGKLQHPGIVPVYGMGASADGRPYYAMRFIEGGSLKEAIEAFHNQKTKGAKRSEQVLELQTLLRHFLDACNAIHYAHSQQVLHRDIKPGNIMLNRDFGETLVVDWGMAKDLKKSSGVEPQAADLYPLESDSYGETQPGSAVGTPEFMSPEQATGQIDQLSPASDVFSLGATLYQILTSMAPYSGSDTRERLRLAAKCDFKPPRQRDPSIPPGLDAVCKKAMAKLPSERYTTARDLATDITRWMADETVSAYREPLSARIGRWARRNRGWTQSAAAALVLVTVISVIATVIVSRARTNEAIALGTQKAIADFLRGLFEDTDPLGFASTSNEFRVSHVSANSTAKELLQNGRNRLRGELVDQPEQRADFLQTIGNVYRGLGLYDDAGTILRESLDLREQHVRHDAQSLALNVRDLAWSVHYAGNFEEAAGLYEDALSRLESVFGPDHAEVASTKVQYALLLADVAEGEDDPKHAKALKLLDDAIELRRRLFGPKHQAVAIALAAKAAALFENGEEGQARNTVLQAWFIFEEHKDSAPAGLALGNYSRGLQALEARNYEQAADLIGEAIALAKKVVGNDHPYVAFALSDYGSALLGAKRYSEAEAAFDKVKQVAEQIRLRSDHPKLATLRRHFADLYLKTDRGAEAETMLRANQNDARSNYGEDSRQYAAACQELGYVLQELGRPEEALAQTRRALELVKSVHASRPERIAFFAEELGIMLYKQGSPSEAIQTFGEAVAYQRQSTSDRRGLADSLLLLGDAQLKAKHWETASKSLTEAREQFLDFGRGDRAARAQALLGDALLNHGDKARAEEELLAAFETLDRVLAQSHDWNKHVRRTLAELYEQSGKGEKAAEYRK